MNAEQADKWFDWAVALVDELDLSHVLLRPVDEHDSWTDDELRIVLERRLREVGGEPPCSVNRSQAAEPPTATSSLPLAEPAVGSTAPPDCVDPGARQRGPLEHRETSAVTVRREAEPSGQWRWQCHCGEERMGYKGKHERGGPMGHKGKHDPFCDLFEHPDSSVVLAAAVLRGVNQVGADGWELVDEQRRVALLRLRDDLNQSLALRTESLHEAVVVCCELMVGALKQAFMDEVDR